MIYLFRITWTPCSFAATVLGLDKVQMVVTCCIHFDQEMAAVQFDRRIWMPTVHDHLHARSSIARIQHCLHSPDIILP